MISFEDTREYEFVSEDPVTISDGLAVCQTASLEISKKVPSNVTELIAFCMNRGYIKVKVNKLKKRRDWIKL
jgi:hypothetical protein